MVNKAHSMGMWVMLDVVANHVAPVDLDYSQINPLNKAEYYHQKCDINWDDQWSIEHCRLANLPDLDQDNLYVRNYLKDWIKTRV